MKKILGFLFLLVFLSAMVVSCGRKAKCAAYDSVQLDELNELKDQH
ncbi:hypothetical protein [Halocola ammonii]